ncbi:MAG TPA: hypothetical protein DDW94_10165 [Deltaproteobacteria bacterium]|nr:MAG: hypothetical protein A2Z79_12760 [Deltaproteobacteria bacterium GWA2_55_82]OGQ63747.1 MAG: hypothetical protein A3I81_12275 [Deltaproteobacteria bacterium RIFCSPLOWO2_02_FULL_55_12]OIJ73470.1 MAG: hypothetical protein A2V21_303830 [Deltaproteobacteria bacterium GWC2_55_46]HBG47336.1 hypothetical protein [Deltaproteobacteria bacterium]HCY10102.1 hypothetical protein [Deltaproteobacteria bacterium]
MKKKTISTAALAVAGALFISAQSYADVTAKAAGDLKATLSTDPAKSMVDLFLKEFKSGNAITSAKVKARVTFPNGTTVEKELIGMKMGDAYSYMNSLDFSRKGRYIFNITIVTPKKTVSMEFTHRI